MNHYHFVLSTELLADEDYVSILQALGRGARLQKHHHDNSNTTLAGNGSHFISMVRPVCDMEDEAEHANQNNLAVLWSELSDNQELSDIVVYPVPISESDTENPNFRLLERIHELAENLPKIGIFLSVDWLIKDEVLPPIDENVELYGAVKRLLEWNNADCRFVILSDACWEGNKAEPWVTMLRGHVTTINDLHLQYTNILWRGSMNVVGTNIRKLMNFVGFELTDSTQAISTEDPGIEEMTSSINVPEALTKQDAPCTQILSDRLEVLAQLDRQEVPLLYYTGQCYTVRVRSDSRLVDRSRQLIQRLEDNHRLAYLVRLCHGSSWRYVEDDSWYRDKNKMEKKSWVDYTQENIQHVVNCPTLPELTGTLGQHVLLLCAAGTDSGESSCAAHLLHRPDTLSGVATHDTIVSTLWRSAPDAQQLEHDTTAAEAILSGLPQFTGKQVVQLQQCIKQAQLAALEGWRERQIDLGRSVHISSDMLIALMAEAHNKVVQDLCGSDQLHHQRAALDDSDEEEDAVENKQPPYHHLEKLVLVYQSQAESRFGRYKSNDSLAGLSPPSRGKVLNLNATEFIKFFKADGTAAQDLTSQVTLKKRSHIRCFKRLQPEELKIDWPQCESLQYHDVYYNQGPVEAMEAKSKRLLNGFLTTETSSTCIYRQAHSAAVMPVSTERPQHESDTDSKVTPEKVKRLKVTPERVTRSAKKQREGATAADAMRKDSKRLYAARKIASKANTKQATAPKVEAQPSKTAAVETKGTSDSSTKTAEQLRRESRSQRHKRRLEDIVKATLKKEGLTKADPLFKACAFRLYNITKSFVKDLTSSVGLSDEMKRIAESNAPMIVDFERKNPRKK